MRIRSIRHALVVIWLIGFLIFHLALWRKGVFADMPPLEMGILFLVCALVLAGMIWGKK